ncbi:LysM peptidoglycan-binding domain-containing protein [Luteolibacter algae]|uniref:LysM peptidoglycan-binding domain-containing protein n=1 Tax=Luteolibacter algae TaxID=454151 RepID=A0ABW5D8X1_9BACT
MTIRLATLLTLFATSGPLLSATEVERLRALCAEQEMQIKQLETKIARLTDTPPPSRNTPVPEYRPAAEAAYYTVQPGDSIERIARKNGTSIQALASINGLKANSIIHPNQKLKLPGSSAERENSPSSPAPVASKKHTIKSGDTFYKISRQYGVSVDELISANPSVNHRALRVGQVITVSKGFASSGDIATAPTASKPSMPSLSSPPSIPVSNPAPVKKPRASDHPIKIQKEITYGEFAKNHNTTAQRLDELNGLELDPSTVLAQGSELYIPAQP